MGKGIKRRLEDDSNPNEISLPAKYIGTGHARANEKRLIVVLDNAQLEIVKVKNTFELLNCDEHGHIMKKNNRPPIRPDIVHQSLLMLMDSPLNRAGLLQVYIRTEKNVLIEINPQTRIPRTFKRFAGMMVQLLHKFCIRAGDTSVKLLKVIKNPITDHLPVGCKKLATSFTGRFVENCKTLVPTGDEPVAIVIGAFAHGVVKAEYAEDLISISRYPLSAALACTKLCNSFEEVWGIV